MVNSVFASGWTSGAWPATNSFAFPIATNTTPWSGFNCVSNGIWAAVSSQTFTSTATGTTNIVTRTWPCELFAGLASNGLTSALCPLTALTATSACLQVEDTWLADSVLAENERVLAVGSSLPFVHESFHDQNHVKLAQAKAWIREHAQNFAIKELADTNGSFNTWCATPQTNWTWTVRSGDWWDGAAIYTEMNHWIPAISYRPPPHWPIFAGDVTYGEWFDGYSPIVFNGSNRVPQNSFPPAPGSQLDVNPDYSYLSDSEATLLELLNLPRGYITYVATNSAFFTVTPGYYTGRGGYIPPSTNWGTAAPGWVVGALTTQYTNLIIVTTNTARYGSFFRCNPENNFFAPAAATSPPSAFASSSGLGHLVTQRWDFVNEWLTWSNATYTFAFNTNTLAWTIATNAPAHFDVTNADTIVTNSLVLSADSGLNLSEPYYSNGWVNVNILASNSVLFTRQVLTTTNSTQIYTNRYCVGGTNCFTNIFSVTFTNTATIALTVIEQDYSNAGTNTLILQTNQTLFSAISQLLTPLTTNCAAVFTNWPVAAGYTERDYGWDGIQKCLNDLVWPFAILNAPFYSQINGYLPFYPWVWGRYGTNSYSSILGAALALVASADYTTNTFDVAGVVANPQFVSSTNLPSGAAPRVQVQAGWSGSLREELFSLLCVTDDYLITGTYTNHRSYTNSYTYNFWYTSPAPTDRSYAYWNSPSEYIATTESWTDLGEYDAAYLGGNEGMWAMISDAAFTPNVADIMIPATSVTAFSQPGIFVDVATNYESARDVYIAGNVPPDYWPGPPANSYYWRNTNYLPVSVDYTDPGAGQAFANSGLGDFCCACPDYAELNLNIFPLCFKSILVTYPTYAFTNFFWNTYDPAAPNLTATNLNWTQQPIWSHPSEDLFDSTNYTAKYTRWLDPIDYTNIVVDRSFLTNHLIGTLPSAMDQVRYWWGLNESVYIIERFDATTNGFPHRSNP